MGKDLPSHRTIAELAYAFHPRSMKESLSALLFLGRQFHPTRRRRLGPRGAIGDVTLSAASRFPSTIGKLKVGALTFLVSPPARFPFPRSDQAQCRFWRRKRCKAANGRDGVFLPASKPTLIGPFRPLSEVEMPRWTRNGAPVARRRDHLYSGY